MDELTCVLFRQAIGLSTAAREGRLAVTPWKTEHYLYAERCAQECLALPITVCLSFNYDYGSDGMCELLDHIEGHTTHVRRVRNRQRTFIQRNVC